MLTVETEPINAITNASTLVLTWCRACGEEFWMITTEEAAAIEGVSTDTIYRWVEAGKIHFVETGDESFLICINSLLR